MNYLNGAFIRDCVAKLPANVFDFLADEFAYIFENPRNMSEYIKWKPTCANHNCDDVADDYGFLDFETMTEEANFYVVEFDEGVLIIE